MFPMTPSQSWLFIILTFLVWVFGGIAIREHIRAERMHKLAYDWQGYADYISETAKETFESCRKLSARNAELDRKLGEYAKERAIQISLDYAKETNLNW